ncbi:hypothetical protein FNV43_RR08177 [Rhamnella rubrinervis]|uniref:Trichome birefringence-like C-terminal domain-containing protein n=1 Tax=Rhamnella rubrinervis TaxID=2594499 RepID=A0A8K0HGM3_9ROSA|nr:hypothetical protein FNV43_RR08177 [Rhamnella rubrinervis]
MAQAEHLPEIDYAIISGGHWFFRVMYLHQGNNLTGCVYCSKPTVTNYNVSFAIQMAFRTALSYINSCKNCKGLVTFLRTLVPAHFENGHGTQEVEEIERAKKEVKSKGKVYRIYPSLTLLLKPYSPKTTSVKLFHEVASLTSTLTASSSSPTTMAPLKRLRKASDKSTEATTVTELAAATKKRSREVSRRIIPEGAGDIAHLTVISNLQVALKVIYNKLQEGIDQFEASIFGDFTRMKTVQFCGGFEAEMRNLSYSSWTKYFGESGPMTQTELMSSPTDRSRLVKKNNFTIIENDNLLEKYPWGTYAMILRFQMWGFHVIPMVPTMTSLRSLSVSDIQDARIPFHNILHYNRLAASSTKTTYSRGGVRKTYMINLGKADDKQYVGPPVVHVPHHAAANEQSQCILHELAHNLNPRVLIRSILKA